MYFKAKTKCTCLILLYNINIIIILSLRKVLVEKDMGLQLYLPVVLR